MMKKKSFAHPIVWPRIDSWQDNPRLIVNKANGANPGKPTQPLRGNQTQTPKPVAVSTIVPTSATYGGTTIKKVTSSFLNGSSDPAFSHVDVWVQGYLGNPNPVKVTSGTSPITAALQQTGENVTLIFQSIGIDGTPLPLASSPRKVVSLA